jgi:putative FmdB family regulatory protein
MPTYEYACRSCGSQIEVVQSFTDEALTTCGECGGPLRKVFSAVGISFKGSGFYKTDSRSGSGKRTSSEPTSTKASEPKATPSSGSDASSSSSPGSSGSTTAAPAATTPSST